LVEHGASGVTFSSVGKAARVARQTLYRHWSTREQLIGDVLIAQCAVEAINSPEQTPQQHLREFLRNARTQMSTPAIASACALLMSHATIDAVSAQTLRTMIHAQMNSLGAIWGELDDAEYSLIVGPIVLQLLVFRVPVTDKFIEVIVTEALARAHVRHRKASTGSELVTQTISAVGQPLTPAAHRSLVISRAQAPDRGN